MPTLKQITCTVEWSGSNMPLKEYQTTYGDGYVQSFIAVPPISTFFSVHLQSKGYIAPGLAMFVYMDGEYQCNRNRLNLEFPSESTPSRKFEVDFRVRQKEELQQDGTFAGSQWKFRELDVVPDFNTSTGHTVPHNLEYIGTIEVVVLRCNPTKEPTNQTISPPIQTTRKVQFKKVNGRIAAPQDSSGASASGTSSTGDSWSDEDDYSSALGGLLDGANDDLPHRSDYMPFGGDALWDNTGRDWNNGGQGQWQQQGNSRQWDDAVAANNSPTAGHGQAASGQWDNQPSHGSNVHQSTPRSNNSSKRSRQSSGTVGIPHVPNSNTTWEAQQAVQPSTASPAVVVNVIQPGASFMPSTAPPGWGNPTSPANIQSPNNNALPPPIQKQSPNGSTDSSSNQSGSKHSGSNNNEANGYDDNDNDNWQATTGGAHDSATGAKTPKVPGAWGDSDSNPQAATDWNNNDNVKNGWVAPSNNPSGGQNPNKQDGWNTGGPNDRNNGDHLAPENNWGNTNAGGSGTGNDWWNNDNNSPQQTGGAKMGEQNALDNNNSNVAAELNGNGSDNTKWNRKQPNQGQNWGMNTGNDNTGDSLGNTMPILEGSQHGQSHPSKQSRNASSIALGRAPPVTAVVPPMNLHPKPYWSIWKPGSDTDDDDSVAQPEVAEGPIYSVPKEAAQRHMMSHQVLLGRSTTYMHKTGRPKYMDSHENPYAAFTFHYRSKDVLEKMLGVYIEESVEEEKNRLSSLSKEELIEHLLKRKASCRHQKSTARGFLTDTIQASANAQEISSSSTNSSSIDASRDTVIDYGNTAGGAGLGIGGLLANRLSPLATKNKTLSNKPSTNPELLWGRPANQEPVLNSGPHASTNDNVAGWLNNSGGGHAGSPTVGLSQGAWVPTRGGRHVSSAATSPPQDVWTADNGMGNTPNDGNAQAAWSGRNYSTGQPPQASSPWRGSNNGNGQQPKKSGSWKGSNYNGGDQNGGAWNNGGGQGNGGQEGGGWNNGNTAPSGSQNGGAWNNGGGKGNAGQEGGGWNNGNTATGGNQNGGLWSNGGASGGNQNAEWNSGNQQGGGSSAPAATQW